MRASAPPRQRAAGRDLINGTINIVVRCFKSISGESIAAAAGEWMGSGGSGSAGQRQRPRHNRSGNDGAADRPARNEAVIDKLFPA